MSGNNNSGSGTSNKINVPESRKAMEDFKYEVANEIGVPLKKGYNGDLTSAQNGYVGGYMVNNIYTKVNNKITYPHRTSKGHMNTLTYTLRIYI